MLVPRPASVVRRLLFAVAAGGVVALSTGCDLGLPKCTDVCEEGTPPGPTARGLRPSALPDEAAVSADWLAPIAVGGHDRLQLAYVDGVEVERGPFRLDGLTGTDIPATVEVHADGAGDGALTLVATEEHGGAIELALQAREVSGVRLIGSRRHRSAPGVAQVWHVSETDAVIAIESDPTAPFGGRLVDASLQLTEFPAGTLIATWDQLRVAAPQAGTHPVTITSASFGTVRTAITFVDQIERLELTVDPVAGVPAGAVPVNRGAKICVFAFTGADEVVVQTDLEVDRGSLSNRDGDNCEEVFPFQAGAFTVTATAAGATRTFDLTAVVAP